MRHSIEASTPSGKAGRSLMALAAGAALVALLAGPTGAGAQTAPKPAAEAAKTTSKGPVKASTKEQHPDFSGYWLQDQGILFSDPTPKHHSGSHPAWDDNVNPIPHTPEAAAAYEAFKAEVRKSGYDRSLNCDPPGMPRLMANPFPMEIVQTPATLFMLFEYKSQIRHIYTDGRPHPTEDDLDKSWNGHSIGKWEGDTLVVDTRLIKNGDGKLIQITGIVHGDDMYTVERIRLRDKDKLELELTIHDPKVFTKPWVNLRTFSRKPSNINVPEYVCLTSKLIQEIAEKKEIARKAAEKAAKEAQTPPAAPKTEEKPAAK